MVKKDSDIIVSIGWKGKNLRTYRNKKTTMQEEIDQGACPICGNELERGKIEKEKQERLKKDSDHLEGKDLHKLVCHECGHISYEFEN
ncbi:MAG: hypothetical protein MUP58_03385 [Candidatus Nanohaloarchaeota archaeon QJJ-9]|nr:hypothetical protein [Candidatus Nanohaloarchaeota archaeon QJJ-9]